MVSEHGLITILSPHAQLPTTPSGVLKFQIGRTLLLRRQRNAAPNGFLALTCDMQKIIRSKSTRLANGEEIVLNYKTMKKAKPVEKQKQAVEKLPDVSQPAKRKKSTINVCTIPRNEIIATAMKKRRRGMEGTGETQQQVEEKLQT